MSAKKTSNYTSKDDTDDFEAISERLAMDLRRSIRQLENFPILSDPWFEMADNFGRIANISDMESKLPSAKADATLWETEEQALRFLLEDGKLNLCLRNLIDFKHNQMQFRKTGKGPMGDFSAECDKFEKGVGVVLKNAWQHVEVLQTTDLPALLNHIADVLEAALEIPGVLDMLKKGGDLHQRQEVLVFYYLAGILQHLEDIREHRIMPLLRERGVFMLAVQVLAECGNDLLRAHRLKCVQMLALLSDTEDFSTYRSEYYHSSDVEKLLAFKEKVLPEFMEDFESRKIIRPLIDCIDKAKRQMRMK